MAASCARAVEVGLPAIAFTEHVDHTAWQVAREDFDPEHLLVRLSDPDGTATTPATTPATTRAPD
jgi:histidinol-phosphatase (PHP family)